MNPLEKTSNPHYFINVSEGSEGFRCGRDDHSKKTESAAYSIAFAVSRSAGEPAAVVLAAAATRPHLLPRTSVELGKKPLSEDGLRAAIAADIAPLVPQNDGYLMRLHTSTVLRAVREMQSK